MTNRQQIMLTKDRRQKTERLTTNTRLKADEQIDRIGVKTTKDRQGKTDDQQVK